MPDRLMVNLGDGQVAVLAWPDGGLPEEVSRSPLEWPLDEDALEDLRWYLEDYLLAPYGVWEDRGPAIAAKLAGWGDRLFGTVFGSGPARFAYERARDRGLEVVFRSAEPGLLSLPWELMRDGSGPVALGAGGISRSLPVADGAGTLQVPGGRLRVLMVISRPAGDSDVGYRMVARPLLERLDAVRGEIALTVLRPPTFDALRATVRQAAEAGEPFHVVHFDGHGAMSARSSEGVLAFEKSGGGVDHIGAQRVAQALAQGKVPVVVLNAAQSGAIGKELEASVATALLMAGCAAVVAMAYSVYAVAAAEFMAAFYEYLFTGASVGRAVTAGRRRLYEHDARPTIKGEMPLADWLVPVHYLRREVSFPHVRTARPAAAPSLDEALDQLRAAPSEGAAAQDPLAPIDGVFVGRDDLFYQLEMAALLEHVVVLTGPGGTGKSELAKGFARWWRDTGGVDDPRLVFWHSFEPGVASFGLDGVVTALGLQVFGVDFARLEPDQRLDTAKRLLAQHRVLLLWDNFESVRVMPDPARATPPLDEAGSAALKDFLQWARDHSSSTVLITSRTQEDWLGQVRRISVGGLNRVEAAQYATYLLDPYPAARRRRQHRSFGELLDWLDGHPLAMRLTLPSLETEDPAALLSELQSSAPLPSGEVRPDRLSSLGASITYSFSHLAERTRRLLPAVCLFHGVADASILELFSTADGVPERFAEASSLGWKTVLRDAAQVGLLADLGTDIYQVHPALPGYLAAYWQAEDPTSYDREREASERALCTASAAFSRWLTQEVTSANAALAYNLLGLQRRTLGAMLGHALDHHMWTDAEDIVRALDLYWDTRGLDAEAAAWADLILDATQDPAQASLGPASSLWLYTTTRHANRQANAGQLDQAAQAYRRALAYLHDQTPTEWTQGTIAVLYHQLGMTAQGRGRLDEAENWYRQSLAIKTALGDQTSLASTYHQLGMTAQGRGRLDEAENWYRQSLAIEEQLGNRSRMASTYHQLGTIAQDHRRMDEAEDWYRKSLAIAEELGDRSSIMRTYHELGVTAGNRGRLDEAEDWYRKSLAIAEELGYQPSLASIFHQLGTVSYLRKRLDEAEDWYRKSLAIAEELGDRSRVASAYHQLGMTAQGRGLLDEAEDWYRKSLAIKEELGDRYSMARTYAQLGLLAEDRGQWLPALEWNIRCVTLFDEFPSPVTGTGPLALRRLTRQLGMLAAEEAWPRVTGKSLPQAIRDFLMAQEVGTEPSDPAPDPPPRPETADGGRTRQQPSSRQ